MPLTVEDGSIVANADSYISEADAQVYLASRGVASAVVVEAFLLQAIDFIESLNFVGSPVDTDTQAMSWPRSGVSYPSGRAVADTEIPPGIARAQAYVANYIATGTDPNLAPERDVKREKVDVLEVEYSDSTSPSSKAITIFDMPAALRLLQPYLANGGSASGRMHHA